MALSQPPAFVGKISISSENNKIFWTEASVNLEETITLTGFQYPGALIEHIASKMTVESAASGSALTYTGTFSVETGKVTLEATGNFNIRNTTSQIAAIWSGGTYDSNDVAFAVEQYGVEHIGFPKSAIASPSTSITSPIPVCGYFSPTRPVYQDTEDPFQASVSKSKSESGASVSFDFTPVYEYTTDFLAGGYNATRTLFLGDLTDADREQWCKNFWRTQRARIFRFYKQKTISTFRQYILTEDSSRESGFTDRRPGVRLWSGEISMQRVKSEIVQVFSTECRTMPVNQSLLDNWELVHPSTGPVALSQFSFNPSNWEGSRTFELVATMFVSGATAGSGLLGRLKLYNLSDGEFVTDTTLSVAATTPTTETSGTLTVGTSSGDLKNSTKVYELRLELVGSSDTTDTVQVGTVYIKVD